MQWFKIISVAIVALCLFAGGIAFDIFVVQNFTNKSIADKNITESNRSKQLEITQNIEVTNKIKPNLLKMSIGITSSNTLSTTSSLTEVQREHITKQLNAILQLSQNYKGICKYKPYVFEPRFSHTESQSGQISGYNVSFNIDCKMQEADYNSYEDFISQVKKIIYNDSWLDFKIRAFDFALTDSLQKEQEPILRELAIKNANGLVAEYNKNFDAKCNIASISFEQNAIQVDMLSAVNTTSNSINYESMPAQLDIKTLMANAADLPISLDANLQIICQH